MLKQDARDPEYDEVFKKALFKSYIIRCQVRQEVYQVCHPLHIYDFPNNIQDTAKARTSMLSATPVDTLTNIRRLANLIKQYDM